MEPRVREWTESERRARRRGFDELLDEYESQFKEKDWVIRELTRYVDHLEKMLERHKIPFEREVA